MKTVSEEWYKAAQRLACYVASQDCEVEEFKQLVKEGNKKEDSIYYDAAVVGGWEDTV